MARLASQAKMGYYPTPKRSLDLISRWLHVAEPLSPQDRVQMLDPCCGEGDALHTIAALPWPMPRTYGVELDTERAARAANCLDEVVQGSIADVRIDPPGAFGLLWLNPPYEQGPRGERMEFAFLRRATLWLAPGGVLVWIVPESVARDQRHAAWLWRHYERIEACRLAAVDYPAFRQVVVVAVRRDRPPTREDLDAVRRWREADWSSLDERHPEDPYIIPVTSGPRQFEMPCAVSPEAIKDDRAGLRRTLGTLLGWDRGPATSVSPLLPLRTGHLVSLLTAGYLDGRVANGTLVIKGYARRRQTVRIDEERGKAITTDTYAVGIRVLDLEDRRWYDLA